jgi:hypothetical protein
MTDENFREFRNKFGALRILLASGYASRHLVERWFLPRITLC